jgi:SAM-dependent methyltransferase
MNATDQGREIRQSGRLGLYMACLARLLRGDKVSHLLRPSLNRRFEEIYRRGIWGKREHGHTVSGLGSELESTETLRRELPGLLDRLGTQTLLDVGCGDFNWLSQIDLKQRYIGVDVVRSVIAENTETYASDPAGNRSFLVLDATKEPLPQADTVLCRDVLFHLSFDDAARLLANIAAMKPKFLLTTSDTSVTENTDIISGDFGNINLQRPPYGLPEPQIVIRDNHVYAGRIIGVWSIDDLIGGAL